nr:hypothetical protein [Pontibacter sp. Tf4]
MAGTFRQAFCVRPMDMDRADFLLLVSYPLQVPAIPDVTLYQARGIGEGGLIGKHDAAEEQVLVGVYAFQRCLQATVFIPDTVMPPLVAFEVAANDLETGLAEGHAGELNRKEIWRGVWKVKNGTGRVRGIYDRKAVEVTSRRDDGEIGYREITPGSF